VREREHVWLRVCGGDRLSRGGERDTLVCMCVCVFSKITPPEGC